MNVEKEPRTMDPEAQSPQGLESNAEPQGHPPMAGLSTHVQEVGGAGENCADPQNTFIHVGFSEPAPRAALSRVGYSAPAAFNSKPTRCSLPGNTTVPGPVSTTLHTTSCSLHPSAVRPR